MGLYVPLRQLDAWKRNYVDSDVIVRGYVAQLTVLDARGMQFFEGKLRSANRENTIDFVCTQMHLPELLLRSQRMGSEVALEGKVGNPYKDFYELRIEHVKLLPASKKRSA